MKEDGKEGALVVEESEEEALDNDEEELFVQAALDSSPKGFPNAGFWSTTVSGHIVGTDEKGVCFSWPSMFVCSLFSPNQGAGSLDMVFRSDPPLSKSLFPALTSAKMPVPVIISDLVELFLPASACTITSVFAITTILSSARILPAGQEGTALGSPSVPFNTSLSFFLVLSPFCRLAERLEDEGACLIKSW